MILIINMNKIDDVEFQHVLNHKNQSGSLVSIDFEKDLRLPIKRSFIVSSSENGVRGKHAHRELNQFLICINGRCNVLCDDGINKKEYILYQSNQILFVPCHIWAEQYYKENETVLLVLCDDIYNEADYIRNYSDFIEFRSLS